MASAAKLRDAASAASRASALSIHPCAAARSAGASDFSSRLASLESLRSAAAVIRATTVFWASSGASVPLDQLTDEAFQALAAGLPENCSPRQVTVTPAPGKDEE